MSASAALWTRTMERAGKALRAGPAVGVVRPAIKGSPRRYRRFGTRKIVLDNPVAGRVVNIGELGFAVETAQGLSVGESCLFHVRLGPKRMRLAGHIRWCRLVGTGPRGDDGRPIFQAGISLDETPGARAWQAALRRLTEVPPHLIWHVAPSSPSRPASELPAELILAGATGRSLRI